MAEKLGSIGKIINVETPNASVFNNIKSEFSKVITALFLCDTPLSFAQLINALFNYETRLADQHQAQADVQNSAAAVAPTV